MSLCCVLVYLGVLRALRRSSVPASGSLLSCRVELNPLQGAQASGFLCSPELHRLGTLCHPVHPGMGIAERHALLKDQAVTSDEVRLVG